MKLLAPTTAVRLLLDFLKDRRSYPEHPKKLRLLQTHASWVIVTDHFVYKVKKPVELGFLDFSTLEKRRHFCKREVLLNRRMSRDVYLDVVPIRRSKQGLSFSGSGEVVEYAVKMKRLSAGNFLLHILKAGRITKRHVNRIVAALTPFYQRSPETKALARRGCIATIRRSTAENFRQVKNFLGQTLSRPAFESIQAFTAQYYRCHGALFRERATEGRIRDCHGDLHLDHIHIAPGKVTIYDCIEFNDRFRLIDIANDVAFLAMDFDFHGRADLGGHLVTRMAESLEDPGMLRVLDFYKCYRAFVRGKVECLRSNAPEVDARERAGSRVRAQRYFRLSLRYAISGSRPMVIVVMGHVATGKSTLAHSLAEALGCRAFSSDRLRKKMGGVSLRARGSKRERARLYSQRVSDRTYAALSQSAVKEIRKGCAVVLDATFARKDRRNTLCAMLCRAGIDYCFVEVRASRSTVRRRLIAREHSVSEISDARLEDYSLLQRTYEPPQEIDSAHFISVKAAGTREKMLTSALRALALRRACFSA